MRRRWIRGRRARACPNILLGSILRAGLEAPATETKAGLEPDERSATNGELRPPQPLPPRGSSAGRSDEEVRR